MKTLQKHYEEVVSEKLPGVMSKKENMIMQKTIHEMLVILEGVRK
jgi:hypothetical protein